MIDYQARQKLLRRKQDGILFNNFSKQQTQQKKGTDLLDSLVKQNEETATLFNKFGQALAMIYRKIPNAVNLPQKFQIWGKVEVANTPSVTVENFSEIIVHQKALLLQIKQLIEAISLVGDRKPPEISLPPIRLQDANEVKDALRQLSRKFPDFSKLPTPEKINLTEVVIGLKNLENRMDDLSKGIVLLAEQKPVKQGVKMDTSAIVTAIKSLEDNLQFPESASNEDLLNALQNINEGIGQLIMRPQMTTPAVTHISINSLNGSILTTQIQLGSTVTPLPAIALPNRRAIQLYNNGSNTIYFGGSNVTTSNGIPVTSGAYSDILDIGVNMFVYGISQSGQNNDIRVLEVSDEASGR